MGWEKDKNQPGFLVNSGFSNSNPIDLSKITPGKTKVGLHPPKGCCGNTLCMAEYTVMGVGRYADKQGAKTILFRLEGGLFVEHTQINYILTPE